jgi:hypothetical protein
MMSRMMSRMGEIGNVRMCPDNVRIGWEKVGGVL